MATKQQIPKLAGMIVEHQEGFEALSSESAQWAILNTREAIGLFVEAVENRLTPAAKKVSSFFRRLNLSVIIPPTNGKRTIYQAKKTFPGYLDSDFRNWGLDIEDKAKPAQPVEVLELIKDGDFKTFFGSLGVDLDRLVLTQDQILWVVENHPEMLNQNGYTNFFLMKKGNEFFVAYVVRLMVSAFRLSSDYVWDAACRHRVVVPQL